MASAFSISAAVGAILAVSVPVVHFIVDTAFHLFGG
jgi:hypothetical protein